MMENSDAVSDENNSMINLKIAKPEVEKQGLRVIKIPSSHVC